MHLRYVPSPPVYPLKTQEAPRGAPSLLGMMGGPPPFDGGPPEVWEKVPLSVLMHPKQQFYCPKSPPSASAAAASATAAVEGAAAAATVLAATEAAKEDNGDKNENPGVVATESVSKAVTHNSFLRCVY